MAAARALRGAARPAARRLASLATARWPPRSRLFLVGENVGWVIDYELAQVARIATRLDIRLGNRRLLHASNAQAVFYGSQFTLLHERWEPAPHALATAYFHGRPGTPGHPEFDVCFDALRAHHRELDRIQVSHEEMHDVVLSSGIDPAKVFRIPIGIDTAAFTPADAPTREAARAGLGVPEGAFVVGSFQKDGVDFGEGREPKAIKGPDVLVDALRELFARVPELHVFLSGPARGYVRERLERLGVPYRHRIVSAYDEIPNLYHALDAYVVPSRQEGGPKGVLEAMATGVPLVTTRVGQATDLVRHEENGWIVDVEDAAGLAYWLAHVASRPHALEAVVAKGLETARANSYESQVPLWREFFDGFVRAGR